MKSWYILVLALLLTATPAAAQQTGWAQISAAAAYEHFGKTYDHAGYTLSMDVEAHGPRSVYGALLVGVGTYEGGKGVRVNHGNYVVSDNLADRQTQILFAAGPGFDLLANGIDRFYLNLYAGYALIRYEHAYYTPDNLREQPTDTDNGLIGMMRLGYEHQVGSRVALGLYAQGGYVGRAWNWGMGVRIGFRTSYFRLCRPVDRR